MLEPRAAELVMARCTPALFYRHAHTRIFWAMENVKQAGLPIDLITVSAELRKMDTRETGNLVAAGEKLPDMDWAVGPEYLTALLGEVPTAAHVNAYIAVLEACRKRYLELARALAVAHDPTLVPAMDDELRRIAEGAAAGGGSKTLGEFEDLGDAVDDHMRKTGEFDHSRPHLGVEGLDNHLGGLPTPGLVVVMGDSSAGKTQAALQAFFHSCFEHPMHGLYCSLEMSVSQVTRRLAYMLQDRKALTRDEITEAVASLSLSETLHIYNRPGMSMGDIEAEAKRLAGEVELSLVIVDYLQLIGRGTEDERSHLERCAQDCKRLAMSTGASVLAITQVSWDKDKTEARAFGARGIGFGADVELEIIRPGKTIFEQRQIGEATLRIRKDRDGEVAAFETTFKGIGFEETPEERPASYGYGVRYGDPTQ